MVVILFLNNHTLSQYYCDSNSGAVSIVYGLKNLHTLFQCEYSITFNNIDDDVEKIDGDVSSGYGFLKHPHFLPM